MMKPISTGIRLNNERRATADISSGMLEALRSGDHEVFGDIYVHYWDPLYNFIRNLIGSSEDAREMTQDIFIVLWESRRRIDPGRRGGIKPYLYGIARNKVMDWFDHKKVESRFERIVSSKGIEEELPADEAAIAREMALITQLVVNQMPKTRREVFTMVVENGMSIDEAAEQMQVSKATISTHLYHARQELRKVLTCLLFFFI